MMALGLGLSVLGVFLALLAIMVVFMGNESAAVPVLLTPLLAGLPLVSLLAGRELWRERGAGAWRAVLAAAPPWLYVLLGVLLAVLAIAVLSVSLAAGLSGTPLPARFHIPVVSLAVYLAALALFAGLLARRRAAAAPRPDQH